MAYPKGNRFWEIRASHGVETLFGNPGLLAEAAGEYFEWCENNPWIKNEAIKSGDNAGQIVGIPTSRPYTIYGLCIYLDCGTTYFNNFEADLKKKPDSPLNREWAATIKKIREAIYTNKYEGGAVGAYNATIISRDLGLMEKTQISGDAENPIGGAVNIYLPVKGSTEAGFNPAIDEDDLLS